MAGLLARAPVPCGISARPQLRSVRQSVRTFAAPDVSKMAPMGDRVLVKPLEQKDESEGGVLLTGNNKSGMDNGPQYGTVVSTGPDVTIDVKEGDAVCYTKMGSADLASESGDVVFVYQDSIYAKLS